MLRIHPRHRFLARHWSSRLVVLRLGKLLAGLGDPASCPLTPLMFALVEPRWSSICHPDQIVEFPALAKFFDPIDGAQVNSNSFIGRGGDEEVV